MRAFSQHESRDAGKWNCRPLTGTTDQRHGRAPPSTRHGRALRPNSGMRGPVRIVRNYAADMARAEPDMRPLGALALGAAILSAVLSVTYFFSPLAYLAAAVALPLGLMSRGHDRTRGMGTVALVLAVIAIAAASATLIWI